MFFKQVQLKQSPIHGVGLFAAEHIANGEVVWIPSRPLNWEYTQGQFLSLPPQDREVVRHYGYSHKNKGVWCFSAEDARYINHSENPNVVRNDKEGVTTLRRIEKGEEILQDYRDFEILRKF